ncbi:AAA family ATPase [Candidatus Woesearchaeota archaeon]|nr:AAA family ATPase [Candidatus Woesearchaeota archaeon]
MATKNKEKIDDVVFSYDTDINALEEENKFLRETVENLRREVDHFKKPPLLVCEIKELRGEKAIVRLQNGNEFFVDVSESCKGLKPGDSVLAEQKNLTVVEKIPVSKKFNVEKFVIIEKPKVNWDDVGGLKHQEREIKEVIELPLKKPHLFKKVGIHPPKGILLHGPPGTGKTLLAKAVASSTNSTFIEIVASELVQKFIGEGAKLVNEIFQLAREKSPSIIFIDELDALAATRVDIGTSGEREVQRTFMQLLAEIDGFKNLDNVKIIGCTNREDILDPAITRPGRLDRRIKVNLPDEVSRKEIFRIHTKNMKLEKKTDTEKIVKNMKEFSGAEVKAVCTEAGYFAIRKNRDYVKEDDFLSAITKIKESKAEGNNEFLRMFG